MAMNGLAHERFWDNKAECEDAEKKYQLKLSGAKVEQQGDVIEACSVQLNPRFRFKKKLF
jgi:hypothetical protein